MKTERHIKLSIEPKALEAAAYPTAVLYQMLIDSEEAPVKWKGGKPPKERDAKPTDLETAAAVRVTGNTIEAMW